MTKNKSPRSRVTIVYLNGDTTSTLSMEGAYVSSQLWDPPPGWRGPVAGRAMVKVSNTRGGAPVRSWQGFAISIVTEDLS